MPNRNALLDRHLAALETAEQRAARQLATVYNQARREIVADLISGWNQSAISGPADAERFLRNSGLLSQIDARMKQLEQQVNLQLRGIVTSSTEQGVAQIRAELALLPADIRDNFTGTFDQINNRMIERFLYPAEDGVRLATTSTALALRRELAVGVVQGEAFPTLVRRLMAATPTGEGQAVWVNGQLSAERMVRRTVIAAENGAKVEAIGEVAAQIPQVRKQAIAAIGKNTTDCCLRVHGQIKPVSEAFELVGEPRFADRIMHSPFHWNCRTGVAMYHPAFEESSPTAKMQAEAKAELARRRGEKERKRQAADEQAAARVEERAAVAVQAQAQAVQPPPRYGVIVESTGEVAQLHLTHYDLIPDVLKQRVAEEGVKVYINNNESVPGIDAQEDLRGVRPRGWSEGMTWDSVAGAYSSKDKYVLAGKGLSGSSSLLLHEYGHAAGDQLWYDYDKRVIQAHKAVYDRLDDYFRQDGPGGRVSVKEFFAESFAQTIMDRNLAINRFGPAIVDFVESVVLKAGEAQTR